MTCFNIPVYSIIWVIVPLFLIGCNPSQRFVEKESSSTTSKSQKNDISSSSQNTGKILLTLEGVASYYAHDFHGRKTSNGETYDMHDLTAAHRTLPFGTKIRVINLDNLKTVIVRVNDRGPFKEGRIIDLSLGAAKKIDLVLNGTARVRLEVIEWGTGQ